MPLLALERVHVARAIEQVLEPLGSVALRDELDKRFGFRKIEAAAPLVLRLAKVGAQLVAWLVVHSFSPSMRRVALRVAGVPRERYD